MQSGKRRRRAGAFTLVELLAVIAIIGLLISILLPAVGAVRKAAKNTVSRSVLSSLQTALDNYKADGRVGGGYPYSRSDQTTTSTLGLLNVQSPYDTGRKFEISGAGLLVWALAGADYLGTPGFNVFRTGGTSPSTLWSQDTDAGAVPTGSPDPSQSGAYAMRTTDGQPVQPRATRFIEADNARISKRTEASAPAQFVFDMEEGKLARDYPMFLDAFGFPVLYWRADPAGRRWVDKTPDGSIATTGADRGIYHWTDNASLLSSTVPSGSGNPLRTDGSGGARHRLGWPNGATGDWSWTPPANVPSDSSFPAWIIDRQVQARIAPVRPDSYLLVSPGADGVYGTSDDISNFK